MIKTETATIGGREWQVTTFTGLKSIRVFHAVMAAVGTPLAELLNSLAKAKAARKSFADSDLDLSKVVGMILDANRQPADIERLLFTVLQNTVVDRKAMSATVFDEVFSGSEIVHLYAVVKFVLEANYGDFFVMAASFMSERAPQNPEAEPEAPAA
ncbi:MAG: hypothetical protein DI556_09805 [Rhodovulum sulfidophilum]|uniref:Uncharacterized protein n=1 Tax=Rhodovulum sulfidophilum TaxID=35806 RepID=A0A2W5N8E3_RHOSU|nr:MAG: hypothetical protein DI556_09805 [Rhodovulum sulfidophilum]